MGYYRKLCGEKCYLSPIQTEDADLWATWLNDLEVTIPLGDEAYYLWPSEKTREEVLNAIRRQDHTFTIIDLQTEKPIGRCLIFSIDPVNRSGMIGIFIGEKPYWNLGIGTEATRLLLEYAFNLLNLHSIMLGVFEFNHRAIRTYEKIGFQKIGIRREARIIAGKKWGVVMMDILEDEFREMWPNATITTP